MTDAVSTLSARLGILPDYIDLDGKSRCTSRDTQSALLAAMGVDASNEKRSSDSLRELDADDASGNQPDWRVIPERTVPPLDFASDKKWHLMLEDGTEAEGRGSIDIPRLPRGRHLLMAGGKKTWILAAPTSLPRPRRAWGVTAPLAGLRCPAQGGLGDFKDLGEATLQCAAKGAAFFGINPIHAGFPTDKSAHSPYSPSHRQWLNTSHIAIGAPGAGTGSLIDYPKETRAQHIALRNAFDAAGDTDAFIAFLAEKGDALTSFAIHQALSEKYGPYWCDWPMDLRNADAKAVLHEASAMVPEIRFHAWSQFLAEMQLTEISNRCETYGMAFGLYLDLAVGTHPFGAETWENPGLFARDVSLGAPPDAFAPDGQNWNLAPMVPRMMEAEGFATLAATLRRQFQFAKLLRIDHILGFERAFWATGQPDLPGAYVEMPRDAMLAVTRIEAARAGATVIGEDLGNIPAGLQSELKAAGLLGCRLIVFEHDVPQGGGFKSPHEYDAQTLASFSTHDLPTWRGWRKGTDVVARHKVGHLGSEQKTCALAQRETEVVAFDSAAGDRGMHAFLAESAADLVAVQIENVFEIEDQPNLPGTTDEYPNWGQRLPIAVTDYFKDARFDRIAKTMSISGRGTM